jgi:hypothetical protein
MINYCHNRQEGEAKIVNKDYEFFKANAKQLYKNYGHKFLVIKDCQVIGVYDNFALAAKETLKTEALGTFIVQECVENFEKNMVVFHSNILGLI